MTDDGLQRLWTPHRLAYVAGGENKPVGDGPEGCPFCLSQARLDEEVNIIVRGEHVFALLNLYPYNSGHLMVCPQRHVADYTDLTPAEAVELAEFTQKSMRALRLAQSPHGFNIGMNQGSAAGAGIAAHLHQHVVPRWSGDANFMPIVGQTKVIPQLLPETRKLLVEAWNSLG
ncbi:HIT domain-containing protein [Longispora sp. NPDC051575]|uniref:HIT family protein n=1 Tax=Longispora sp. NPDC051575 TaxID=3154943 RepID=UPI003425DBFB